MERLSHDAYVPSSKPVHLESKQVIPSGTEKAGKQIPIMLENKQGLSTGSSILKPVLPITSENILFSHTDASNLEEIENALDFAEQLVSQDQPPQIQTNPVSKQTIFNPLLPLAESFKYSNSIEIKGSTSSIDDFLKETQLDKVYEGLSVEKKKEFNEGLDFVQSLIPPEIASRGHFLKCPKKIKELKKTAHFLLNEIATEHSHKNNLITSYKALLLKSSEELYAHLDRHLDKIIQEKEKENAFLEPNIKNQIANSLQKWKIDLEMKKGQLDPDVVKLGLAVVSTSITGISLTLNSPLFHLIPSQVVIQVASFVLEGLSLSLSLFRIVVLGVEILIRNKQIKKIDNWMDKFQSWKKEIQAIPSKTNAQTGKSEALTKPRLKEKFSNLIENSNIEEIRKKLEKVNIHIDSNIKTKWELNQKFNSNIKLRETVEQAYIDYHVQYAGIKEFIASTNDLYIKRKAIHKKNMIKVQPRLEEILQNQFIRSREKISEELQKFGSSRSVIDYELNKWINNPNPTFEEKDAFLTRILNIDNQKEIFNDWFGKLSGETKEKLLSEYVDRQAVIDISLKGALIQMVSKKHQVEGILSRFKFRSAKIYFSVAVATLSIGAALSVISMLVFPIPAIGLILLSLSAGSLLVTIGLIGASVYLGNKYTPKTAKSSFKALSLRIFLTKTRHDILQYRHQKKMNKMIATSSHLNNMNLTFQGTSRNKADYKAAESLKVEKMNMAKSEEKLKEWSKRLENLESKRKLNGWLDFAKQADLEVISNGLDGLNRLNEAFTEIDFDLLSKETKYLLEVQMGMDLKHLEKEMKKNPEEFKNMLKEFTSLLDLKFSSFVKRQSSLMKKGLIKQKLKTP